MYREFTVVNGCFDILHSGHVELIRYAKNLNPLNRLIVFINSDNSEAFNRKRVPINSLADRMTVMSSLYHVNEVISFTTEKELEDLLKSYKPQFMVKHSEYEGKPITGKSIMESYGGQVIFYRHNKEISTTSIIDKIISLHNLEESSKISQEQKEYDDESNHTKQKTKKKNKKYAPEEIDPFRDPNWEYKRGEIEMGDL